MTDQQQPQKEDFKKTRDAAYQAEISSSKALQDDALTQIEGKAHDDIDALNKEKD